MKTKCNLFLCSVLGAAPMAGVAANNALSFDGANDYVTFGSASRLGASNFTIEVWFRRTGAGTTASTGSGGVTAVPLLAKGRGEADGSNRDMNYFLGIRASDNVLVADFEEGANGTTPGLNHPIAGVTPISNNVWHHAAATYDGATWRLYLNGALEGQLTVNQPVRANSIQHASLATALNSSGSAQGFFRGALDEARVWNYARSGEQIGGEKRGDRVAGGLDRPLGDERVERHEDQRQLRQRRAWYVAERTDAHGRISNKRASGRAAHYARAVFAVGHAAERGDALADGRGQQQPCARGGESRSARADLRRHAGDDRARGHAERPHCGHAVLLLGGFDDGDAGRRQHELLFCHVAAKWHASADADLGAR
jgi:hypothetical protein